MTQVKTFCSDFSATSPDIDEQINTWLKANPKIEFKGMVQSQSEDQASLIKICVTIWYSENP